MQYLVTREGQNYGPYSIEELKIYLQSGRLAPEDLAWHEGDTEWRPLSNLPELAHATAPTVLYHHVSPLKFVIMSIGTLGLYELYWFYKNWKYVRTRDNSRIMPFWRAIFSPVWCYSLGKDVFKSEGRADLTLLSIVAVTYLILSVVWRLPDPYWLVSVFSFVPLLALVRAIDATNRELGLKSEKYNRFRLHHVLVCLIGSSVLLFATLSSVNYFPSTQVITGERLWQKDLQFLRDKEVITPSESILFFYSSGLLSIESDGNLITDQRVASYYYDLEAEDWIVESARFEEIENIEVHFSESAIEDTEIIVSTGKESGFVLQLSAENKRDRLFVDKLKELWRKHRPDLPVAGK